MRGILNRLAVCALVLALIATLGNCLAADDSTTWVEQLNALAQHVGHSMPPESVRAIVDTPTSRPEIRALRAALLYRVNPAPWDAELTATFTVHDYAERARGNVTNITQEDLVSKIKDIESSYPSMNPQVVMLVAFVRYRDANLWFAKGDQRFSLARFLRGAFLAQVFMGTSLDAVTVASQLDDRARKEYVHQTRSK